MSIMLFAAAASAFQAPATPPLRLHRAVASSAVLGQGAPVMVAGAPAMIPTASRPAFIASAMAASRPVQALICVLVVGFLVLANEMKKRDSLLDDSESCEMGNEEACAKYDEAVGKTAPWKLQRVATKLLQTNLLASKLQDAPPKGFTWGIQA